MFIRVHLWLKMRSILITGTDTGIGKTRVAGIIARLLSAQGRVQVVKPVTGVPPSSAALDARAG